MPCRVCQPTNHTHHPSIFAVATDRVASALFTWCICMCSNSPRFYVPVKCTEMDQRDGSEREREKKTGHVRNKCPLQEISCTWYLVLLHAGGLLAGLQYDHHLPQYPTHEHETRHHRPMGDKGPASSIPEANCTCSIRALSCNSLPVDMHNNTAVVWH